mmetsp:Transcript_19242/g.42687  ORF Transcript_19242/g.42687 Transcript_19242/m.42687 type:complete len:283 (-) Transcript_19242:345-1193(-)
MFSRNLGSPIPPLVSCDKSRPPGFERGGASPPPPSRGTFGPRCNRTGRLLGGRLRPEGSEVSGEACSSLCYPGQQPLIYRSLIARRRLPSGDKAGPTTEGGGVATPICHGVLLYCVLGPGGGGWNGVLDERAVLWAPHDGVGQRRARTAKIRRQLLWLHHGEQQVGGYPREEVDFLRHGGIQKLPVQNSREVLVGQLSNVLQQWQPSKGSGQGHPRSIPNEGHPGYWLSLSLACLLKLDCHLLHKIDMASHPVLRGQSSEVVRGKELSAPLRHKNLALPSDP